MDNNEKGQLIQFPTNNNKQPQYHDIDEYFPFSMYAEEASDKLTVAEKVLFSSLGVGGVAAMAYVIGTTCLSATTSLIVSNLIKGSGILAIAGWATMCATLGISAFCEAMDYKRAEQERETMQRERYNR